MKKTKNAKSFNPQCEPHPMVSVVAMNQFLNTLSGCDNR